MQSERQLDSETSGRNDKRDARVIERKREVRTKSRDQNPGNGPTRKLAVAQLIPPHPQLSHCAYIIPGILPITLVVSTSNVRITAAALGPSIGRSEPPRWCPPRGRGASPRRLGAHRARGQRINAPDSSRR